MPFVPVTLSTRIAAICDIYDDQVAKGAEQFPGAKRFKKYEELLHSDIDAVVERFERTSDVCTFALDDPLGHHDLEHTDGHTGCQPARNT